MAITAGENVLRLAPPLIAKPFMKRDPVIFIRSNIFAVLHKL